MQRVELQLNGASKQDRAIQCANERTINMYLAQRSGSKSDQVLYSNPGLKSLDVVGLGPHRCNPEMFDSKIWWVSGSELYSQDVNNVFTLVGTLSTSNGHVSMAAGRTYLVIVDGQNGYYTDGSTLTQISDADFPSTPGSVTYIDGYFPVNDSSNDDFYINTTTENPINWNALDFEAADAKPDKGKRAIAHGRDLFILGERTMQPYYNSGNADFPFTSYPNTVDIGIDAIHSAVSSSRGLIFLASHSTEGGKSIVMTQGSSGVQEISDPELNWQISQLSTTSDAVAWVRHQGDSFFYEINFPSEKRCWSINLDIGKPCEWKSYNYAGFYGVCHGYLDGKHYLGMSNDGTILQLDYDTYTDNSNAFIRTRRTKVFHREGRSLTIRELIFDIKSGVGLKSGQGSDPLCKIRYSVDGGHSWSSWIERSLGKTGEYKVKPNLINLGEGVDWVLEISVSDPVDFALFRMYADIEVGRF